MTRRKWLLGLASGLLLLMLGVTAYPGGFGFFHAPAFNDEFALQPAAPKTTPTPSVGPSKPVPVAKPCNGKPGPIVYYANNPLAAQYDNFAVPLDPRLSPVHASFTPKPDVRQIVTASWVELCHDSAIAKATVAAAFPTWDGLRGQFDWTAGLTKLQNIDWEQATMVYYATPPTPWTMMMRHGSPTHPEPTTYITRAQHAGWYLSIPIDGSHKLLLRSGCGGQPSIVLDIRQPYNHAALVKMKIFTIF